MKNDKGILIITITGIVCFLFFYCEKDDVLGPGNQSNDRIVIINDETELTDRVCYSDEEVQIDISGGGQLAKIIDSDDFSLTLVAEVSPPSIDGQDLQATSITLEDDIAIVSYNMRGEQYLGAIDVFTIRRRNRPRLISQALFLDTDINSVSYDDGYVYAAGATGDGSFPDPAVLERILLRRNRLVLDNNQQLPLTSYAGTCVSAPGNTIYTTSGDDGGLFSINQESFTLITSIPLHDARWVDVEEDKVIVVQGTPGQISVYDENDLSSLGTYSFTGADIAESKSTVEVVGENAFIAAGTGGVQVLSVNTGVVVGSVPRPDPASLGLDESVVVTNSVSVDDDLLFISNGEAGVYVAQGDDDFDDIESDEQLEITLLGMLRFEDLQSVNHVAYEDDYLIIASGLGGLKIVEIEED